MSGLPSHPDIVGTVFDDPAPELAASYSEALLNAATNENQVDPILDELDELIDDVWRGQPEFAAILVNPGVRLEEKDRLLVETLEGQASSLLVRFLRVVNRHGRLDLVPSIARRARASWDRRQNRQPITIRSAVPLDDSQVETIRQRLVRLTGGKTPILNIEVDPELLGGLIIQIGDRLYDASLRSRLKQFHQYLLQNRAREIQTQREQFSMD